VSTSSHGSQGEKRRRSGVREKRGQGLPFLEPISGHVILMQSDFGCPFSSFSPWNQIKVTVGNIFLDLHSIIFV
jgi:hypothetical protein